VIESEKLWCPARAILVTDEDRISLFRKIGLAKERKLWFYKRCYRKSLTFALTAQIKLFCLFLIKLHFALDGTWYVLIYLSKYLDQETAKRPLRLFVCYYLSNHSKVEVIQLRASPKDTTSELVCLSSHYLFNAERQAEKLCIPIFKVF